MLDKRETIRITANDGIPHKKAVGSKSYAVERSAIQATDCEFEDAYRVIISRKLQGFVVEMVCFESAGCN